MLLDNYTSKTRYLNTIGFPWIREVRVVEYCPTVQGSNSLLLDNYNLNRVVVSLSSVFHKLKFAQIILLVHHFIYSTDFFTFVENWHTF